MDLGLTVTRQRLEQVPLLLVSEGDALEAAQRGTILVFHGLGASKDVQLPDLASLAQHGFLAVGVDNVGHGARRHPDFDERFSQGNPAYNEAFLEAVLETAQEVPALVDALTRQGFIEDERLGAVGISMGGYITYTAVTLEPRLKAAVAIVGSPEWLLDRPESPHRHLEAFAHVALLSQTAGRDEVVPGRYARIFHERLERLYNDHAARFAYIDYPASDHLLGADWDRLWERTLGWFDKHLV